MSRKKYTSGFEDMERVLDYLFDEFKKAQRAEWLRQHYSRNKQLPNKPGGKDESYSKP